MLLQTFLCKLLVLWPHLLLSVVLAVSGLGDGRGGMSHGAIGKNSLIPILVFRVQYQGRDSLDVCLKVFRCVELLQYAQLLIIYA